MFRSGETAPVLFTPTQTLPPRGGGLIRLRPGGSPDETNRDLEIAPTDE